MIKVNIPDNWPYEHIPTWEYDEYGDIEVSHFMCCHCEYFGNMCKCINHNYVHFARPWFSCDILREHHDICNNFKPSWDYYPAGCIEWDALGGFDEWYRLYIKQYCYNRNPPLTTISLHRAIKILDAEHDKVKHREFCDDVYIVSYNDFLKMQKQMKMFGSMDQILGMIPGINISKNDREKISHEGDKQFKKMEVFISSMTPEERNNPELMNTSRKKRIAKGCGMEFTEVTAFVKQFEQMRTMMKGMSDMKNMFGKFKGGTPDISKMGNLGGFKGKLGKHAVNKAMKMMRKFK